MYKALFIFLTLPFFLSTSLCSAAKTGCLQGDCKNGRGILAFPNGSKFEGEFKDGEYHGTGTFTFANGSVYTGGYKSGKYHGQGRGDTFLA